MTGTLSLHARVARAQGELTKLIVAALNPVVSADTMMLPNALLLKPPVFSVGNKTYS